MLVWLAVILLVAWLLGWGVFHVAGGLIHVYREIRGYSEHEARQLALGIEANLNRILATAGERSITPLLAARELAQERLDAARREPAAAA